MNLLMKMRTCFLLVHQCSPEADNIVHEIQYYYEENKLFRDPDCMLVYDMITAIEDCTDLMYDVAKTFIRLNIYEVKDNIVSSFMSAGFRLVI